ncbi:hypothetical protein ES705_51149 [subsurface metagenome]
MNPKDYTNTTWTHRILNFFDQLGRLLGYQVVYEKHRYDLTWWDYSDGKKIFFHLEHENSTKKKIIEETFESKIFGSPSEIAMAICYQQQKRTLEN